MRKSTQCPGRILLSFSMVYEPLTLVYKSSSLVCESFSLVYDVNGENARVTAVIRVAEVLRGHEGPSPQS